MPKPTVRFAVVDEGKPRCVLSIAEMKDGTLILNLRAKQFAGDTAIPFSGGLPKEEWGTPIQEYRYTIHMSDDSKMGINTIKLHHDLEDGTSFTAVQYTSAVKQTRNFAPLYARHCTTLADEGYDIKKRNGRFESLGPITKHFTLILFV